MTTHDLKIAPEFFAPVLTGEKRFEIRRNDRDYQVGDLLTLREREADSDEYTGRSVEARVTYITGFMQRPGYVVLGIEVQR